MGALIRLPRASCLYPECMALEGIEFIGGEVAQGGFADVWKGWLRGRVICIKVLRVRISDKFESLKVCLVSWSSQA